MSFRRSGLPAACAALLLGAGLAACGGPQAPPTAGEVRGVVPDLTGMRVMVFPVQSSASVPGDANAEMTFALHNRAPGVEWVMPDELRRAKASSPGFDVIVDELPVAVFLQAEVNRIGDPLYGNLRRLAALVDARAALIPVAVRYRTAPDSVPAGDTAARAVPHPGHVEVVSALVSVVNGQVVWFGVVSGDPGSPSDPAVLASALDALGRRMGPQVAR